MFGWGDEGKDNSGSTTDSKVVSTPAVTEGPMSVDINKDSATTTEQPVAVTSEPTNYGESIFDKQAPEPVQVSQSTTAVLDELPVEKQPIEIPVTHIPSIEQPVSDNTAPAEVTPEVEGSSEPTMEVYFQIRDQADAVQKDCDTEMSVAKNSQDWAKYNELIAKLNEAIKKVDDYKKDLQRNGWVFYGPNAGYRLAIRESEKRNRMIDVIDNYGAVPSEVFKGKSFLGKRNIDGTLPHIPALVSAQISRAFTWRFNGEVSDILAAIADTEVK